MCCKSNGSKDWNKNGHYQDEWWDHSYLLYKFKNWVANRMKLFRLWQLQFLIKQKGKWSDCCHWNMKSQILQHCSMVGVQ